MEWRFVDPHAILTERGKGRCQLNTHYSLNVNEANQFQSLRAEMGTTSTERLYLQIPNHQKQITSTIQNYGCRYRSRCEPRGCNTEWKHKGHLLLFEYCCACTHDVVAFVMSAERFIFFALAIFKYEVNSESNAVCIRKYILYNQSTLSRKNKNRL